ncbi:MAG TPA: GntR family transcriptional regulator, partial [Spirochaetia bacterium]
MTGDARDDAQPLYLRIYEYLRGEISSSRLRPGDRLPSEKELAVKFAVSRITSKHALELLAGDGSIERVPGKGSFVRTRPAVEPESPQRRGVTKPDCLGLVIPGFDDAFGTTLVCGIEEKCEELGYRLILRRSRDLLEREQRAIEELLAAGVGGILLLPVHGEHYNPVILRLVLEKFPLVLVDRYLRGLAISSVGTD